MSNSSASPIEELNAAIESYNPFRKAAIVTDPDVWGTGFPDLPTLNAHASDAVFQAIKQVQSSQSTQEKVTTLVVTADVGSGKTHLIGRIRRRIEHENNALFVYASANKCGDLNLIKYEFQQALAESLEHTGSQGVMQWQEVAAAMANEAFQAINPNANTVAPNQLVSKFDKVYASWLTQNKNLMNTLSQKVLQAQPNIDPYIIRAILWTLSESQAPFAIRWLSGDELDQSSAEAMGLPSNSNKTNQDREAEALNNIRQILRLLSDYKPVLICFDELEANNIDDAGFTTAQVIARLVKDLFDTLYQSELSQGVVIFTVMFASTWRNQIRNISSIGGGGVEDRILTARSKPIELKPLDSNSVIDLVTLWLREDLYKPHDLTPPHPVYPFQESELRKIGENKPTVREALKWCAENFKVNEPSLPDNPLERFELAKKRENIANVADYLEDNYLIANAISFGFKTLNGKVLEGETSTGEQLRELKIEDVNETIEPQWKNSGRINFKVTGEETNKVFKIGVSVLQYDKLQTVVAGLKRLIDYETFDLTRGCLIRAKEKKIRRNTQAYNNLNKLIQELGGEWVYLNAEEIKPLIELYSIYQKRDKYKLSQEQVFEFSQPITQENPLLLEILSDPSGVIDEETIEEEKLLEDFLSSPSPETTTNEDDLSDLFS